MSEVLKILKSRVEEIEKQAASVRRSNMELQGRLVANTSQLAACEKQLKQFKDAIEKLENEG